MMLGKWLQIAVVLALLPCTASAAPVTQMSAFDATTVCKSALVFDPTNGTWRPKWTGGAFVQEALSRGFTLEYCSSLVGRVEPVLPPPPPQPLPAPSPAPVLTDPLTASIQTLLSTLGFDAGSTDGVIGPKTSAAIAAFQQSIGERPDGRPVEALKAKLQRALAERGPNSAPQSSVQPSAGAKQQPTKPVSSGTGFFINGDIIITNNHVIDGCVEIRARKGGADIASVRVIASNRGDDLAALRSERPSDQHLKLRIVTPIRAAESILVFGYPLTGALSSLGNTTLGNVTALAGLWDDSRYIQISASIQPGNSGGPVLDESGRLVGVIEGKLDALKMVRATGDIPQNVNFAIRASTVANFLEINRITYEPAANTAALPNTQVAEQAEAASVQLECRK
jgi:S1-C subfamily serine protease